VNGDGKRRPSRESAARSPRIAAAAGVLAPLLALVAVPLLSCAKSPAASAGDPPPARAAASSPASDPEPGSATPAPALDGSPASTEEGPDAPLYTEKPELRSYVQSVGRKVASRADRRKPDYRFDIVDSADLNAFTLPGGRIYVTRGLLARMSSEDEMAAALGREIASMDGARDGAGGSDIEKRGMKYATEAGYKARGGADLMRTLAAVRTAEPARLELWLAGHPGGSARLANLDAEAPQIKGTDGDAAARSLKRDPYLRKIDGLPVGWCGPLGYLKGSRYQDIRQDFSIHVPDGWTVQPKDDVLVMLRPADGYRAEVKAQRNLRPGVSGDAAVDYARRAPGEGYEVTKPVGHASLPIGEAGIVTMHRKSESGVVTSVRKMFQTRFDKLYVLTYMVSAEREDETMEGFMKLTGSMKWLTPAETSPPPMPRITLETVKAGETWKSIAAERLGGDWRASALAAWNGRDTTEAPAAGMLIKIPPVAAFE
jgi:predicted Zn-dependent protease